MFTIGQHVLIPYQAAEDLTAETQTLLPLRGVIVGVGPVCQHDAPESERLYVVEMPHDFPGGHDCNRKARARRGAYVTAKNLQLAEYNTVPDVQERYDQFIRDRHEIAPAEAQAEI